MRTVLLVVVLAAAPAWAEASLVAAPSRLPAETQVSALLTSRGFGVSLLVSRQGAGESPRGLVGEAHFAPLDSALELRGGYAWLLSTHGLWAFSAQVGGTAVVPTRGPVDFGLGPSGGVTVGLGGGGFEVFLGAQGAAEVFVRGPGVRLPLRALLGLRARLGGFAASLVGRAGADLEPGLYPTGRAEGALLLGWTGL